MKFIVDGPDKYYGNITEESVLWMRLDERTMIHPVVGGTAEQAIKRATDAFAKMYDATIVSTDLRLIVQEPGTGIRGDLVGKSVDEWVPALTVFYSVVYSVIRQTVIFDSLEQLAEFGRSVGHAVIIDVGNNGFQYPSIRVYDDYIE